MVMTGIGQWAKKVVETLLENDSHDIETLVLLYLQVKLIFLYRFPIQCCLGVVVCAA